MTYDGVALSHAAEWQQRAERAEAAYAEARAAIARVRQLHQQYRSGGYDWDTCTRCHTFTGDWARYPCDTIKALDGSE